MSTITYYNPWTALLAGIIIILFFAAWWFVPTWQARSFVRVGEDDYRKTIGTFLGTIALGDSAAYVRQRVASDYVQNALSPLQTARASHSDPVASETGAMAPAAQQ